MSPRDTNRMRSPSRDPVHRRSALQDRALAARGPSRPSADGAGGFLSCSRSLRRLGWEFLGGEQVPWPSLLARGPYGWAQVRPSLSLAC